MHCTFFDLFFDLCRQAEFQSLHWNFSLALPQPAKQSARFFTSKTLIKAKNNGIVQKIEHYIGWMKAWKWVNAIALVLFRPREVKIKEECIFIWLAFWFWLVQDFFFAQYETKLSKLKYDFSSQVDTTLPSRAIGNRNYAYYHFDF